MEAQRSVSQIPGEGQSILIVERNGQEAERFRRLLSDNPDFMFHLDRAAGFEETMQLLASSAYDLVLLNPRLEGLKVDAAIRAVVSCSGRAPVVVISEHDDPALEGTALRSGAQDFLVKSQVSSTPLPRLFRRAIERQLLVTQLEESRRRAEHLATHDTLTGVPTRPLFEDRARQAVAFAQRYQNAAGFLFMDLDNFKQVNDRFGHATGDLLLKAVTHRLLSTIRGSDTLARIGGDEFVILAIHIEGVDGACQLAEAVIDRVSLPYRIQGEDVRISTSVGIAMYPFHGSDVEDLVRKADQAMYLAKQSGSGQFRVHTPPEIRDLADPDSAPSRRKRSRFEPPLDVLEM